MKTSRRSYWDYYQSECSWDHQGFYELDRRVSEDAFAAAGFNDGEVADLLDSGYIVVEGDLVIDRFYGGLLRSIDSRSRMKLSHFTGNDPLYKQHPARVHHASSLSDAMACIEEWQSRSGRRLLFRGQNQSHPLERKRHNHAYAIEGYGEVSLLPSLWRKMIKAKKGIREEFTNISQYEWSEILYAPFDLDEIRRRETAAIERGEWMYSAQDMEDSDDPLLKEFGRLRLDISMGFNYDLAVRLQTLLQHYGLLSPLLDLTTDIDAALFFATHRLDADPGTGHLTATFIGTNARQSLIYVFRENVEEMGEHEHHRALERCKPQRPLRQSCVVSLGGQDALNLPLEFVFGVIRLDCDDVPIGKYAAVDLFPNESQDDFLAALKSKLRFPHYVTTF